MKESRKGGEEGEGGLVTISRPRVIKGIVFYPKKAGLGSDLEVKVKEGGGVMGEGWKGGEDKNMGMGKSEWG